MNDSFPIKQSLIDGLGAPLRLDRDENCDGVMFFAE